MQATFYKTLLYTVLGVTATFSLFLVCSDNLSPFTTQATMHKTIANIAPEVSGVVTQVKVHNGQHVQAGDVLFSLDKQSDQLAVRQAQAELQQAQEGNSAKWQELNAANQTLAQRQVESHNATSKLARYQALLSKGLITRQDFDDAKASAEVTKAAVEAASADVLRIKATLASDNKTAAIELAEAKLASAKLDLARTDVVAQTAGTVSNLQLQAGSYINKGSVSLFLVNEANRWLSADFNEKGMAHLQVGTPVQVVFDAIPGKVFQGQVLSQDRAVFDASNPSNQLSTVANDSHWIREQQKIRTRIQIDAADTGLISGARASVMVENGHAVVDALGSAWIHLVACFRYLY